MQYWLTRASKWVAVLYVNILRNITVLDWNVPHGDFLSFDVDWTVDRYDGGAVSCQPVSCLNASEVTTLWRYTNLFIIIIFYPR